MEKFTHFRFTRGGRGENVSVTRARERPLNYGRRDTLFTAFLSITSGRVNVQRAARNVPAT